MNPTKATTGMRNVALKYLESLDSVDTSPRFPLKPTLKYNSAAVGKDSDLDKLAQELSQSPTRPLPGNRILRKYDSPSATVSSFKSPKRGEVVDNTPTKPAWMRNLQLRKASPDKTGATSAAAKLSPLKRTMAGDQSPPATASVSPGYEYLCRIQAIKNWLEAILGEPIAQLPVELISYIRNGIHLAKLSNLILPTTRKVFSQDSKLQFKHTENINRFFQLLDYMNVPDLFRFELTDLYDAKNVPKVWFCLHALSYTLSKSDSSLPHMESLVGAVQFSDDDIKTAQRSLVGTGLPNFSSADAGDNDSSYFNAALLPMRDAWELPKKALPLHLPTPPPRLQEPVAVPAPPAEEDNPFIERVTAAALSVVPGDSSVPADLVAVVPSIVKLQALARGSNYRYSMFVDRIMVRSYSDELNQLIAVIRGNMSRAKTIHAHRTELLFFKHDVITLQASARAAILRRSLKSTTLHHHYPRIVALQSILRGQQVRTRQVVLRNGLDSGTSQVVALQSLVRKRAVTSRAIPVLQNITQIEPSVIRLQSHARACLFNRLRNTTVIFNNPGHISKIIQLQALIRSNRVQADVSYTRKRIQRCLPEIHEMQSISRGAIARTKLCNSVLITLIDEDSAFNELFAKVRGDKVRLEVERKKLALQTHEHSVIIPIQSIFRGILVRFHYEIAMEDAFQEVQYIIRLQLKARANRARAKHVAVVEHYRSHVDQVIKCQAIIKSSFAQRAYRELIGVKNPSLAVIKKFAHLLTDNETDLEEEMMLADVKDRIVDLAKINEDVEQQIENLDIKLSLLDRNKISVEDFVKHKNRYKTYKPISLGRAGIDGAPSTTDTSLDKSSRERLELYQRMFYLLQTNPQYMVKIQRDRPETCAALFSTLFPVRNLAVDHHSREEYFYLKLILALMSADMESSKLLSDVTKQAKAHWVSYFLKFNNHTYQRQHVRSILGKFTLNLIDDDVLDFESDTSAIYDKIRDKELRTMGRTSKIEDVSPQVAIMEADVSDKFIENLMSLREHSTEALEIISHSITRVPLHVRVVCKTAYELSKHQFPEKSDQQHLAVAGVIFIKHYLGVILHFPENFGMDLHSAHGDTAANNLKHLARVLLQIFSLKPFNDNFLKPLNDYVCTCADMTTRTIRELINVGDLDGEYDVNQYDDVIAHERPQLTLRVHDMIQIAKLVVENDLVAPSSDPLLHILNQLNDLKGSATKDLIAIAEMGHVTLSLTPTARDDTVYDVRTKLMFTQAKRALLYIIRIQDGPGLLELLISGISPEHEVRFKQIVAQEKAENSLKDQSKRPYYKTSLGDLSQISYRDLKRMALEIILKLERDHQLLTRTNSYQDLLNEIAVDIKTKREQRISRKHQLEIARQSQLKLSQKSRFLNSQLVDYNKHIDRILTQLQSKSSSSKDKKSFLSILPVFSKQYFYQRELRKSNRLPKFGSYIYSLKKLTDQGIIKDVATKGSAGSKFASSSKIDFMFSCNEVGKFSVEAASGSVNIPGAVNVLTLDELLNYQYEARLQFEAFDGLVTFDTNHLMTFIFKKFYHTP